jgi:hypothetical protein
MPVIDITNFTGRTIATGGGGSAPVWLPDITGMTGSGTRANSFYGWTCTCLGSPDVSSIPDDAVITAVEVDITASATADGSSQFTQENSVHSIHTQYTPPLGGVPGAWGPSDGVGILGLSGITDKASLAAAIVGWRWYGGGTELQTSGSAAVTSFKVHVTYDGGAPAWTANVWALVVGGGGAGGCVGGGGAGGGGVLEDVSYTVGPGIYTIIVGHGGLGTADLTPGGAGGNSIFGTLLALGGGGGGYYAAPGLGFGSGGGSGVGWAANGTPGQGHNGGSGNWGVGGGGGAGGDGGNGSGFSTWVGGAGGLGLVRSITGVSISYAPGGGGGGFGSNDVNGLSGGAGGPDGGGQGGAGTPNAANATPGTNGTGGGGGGGGYNASYRPFTSFGANGGSGTVIISYPTGTMAALGGTISYVGANTVHVFTVNGTFAVIAAVGADGTLTPVGDPSKYIAVKHTGSLSPTANAGLLLSRLPHSTEGDIYQGFVLASSTPAAEPWTYDIASGSLPLGLTLDAISGSVTGITPTRGMYVVAIRASHGGYSQQQTFTMVVAGRQKLRLPRITKANTGPDLIIHTARAEDALSANVPSTLLSDDPAIGDVPISVLWSNTAQTALYSVSTNAAQFWRGISEFQAGADITLTPNGQALIISTGGGGGGNAYGTVGVGGQANLVALGSNSVLTFVGESGVVITTNVSSDGAVHFAVNATPLNVNSAITANTANDTTHAFGKVEGDLNVNSASTALTANNTTHAFGKTEGNLNVNTAVTANSANNTAHAFGKTEGNLNVNTAVTANSANNTTYAFGKSEGALNVNSAAAALVANNSTYAFGKSEGNLNVNSAAAALVANNSTYAFGKTEGNLNVNTALTANIANFLAANGTLLGNTVANGTLLIDGLVMANAGLAVNGTVQFNNTVTANGNVGTAAWVLTSGGPGANVYWAAVSAPSSTTNSYGTIEASGVANLVALTGNSVFNFVAGNGVLFTSNVGSDGAFHIAVNGAQQIGNTTITGFANITGILQVAGNLLLANTITANGGVGTATQVLTSGGAGANAYWAAAGGVGGSTNSFGFVGVAGQSNVVALSTNSALTFVAGSGITLTTNVASDGAIHIAAAGGGAALYADGNSGTSKTIDWSLGSEHYLTLTGNCTLTLSNPVDGGRYVLVVNAGVGAFTLAWPVAVSWPDGRTPVVSQWAGKVDIYTLLYSSTLAKYIGSYNQNY